MTTASRIESPTADVLLAARNIAKTYGGTQALRGVNFDIRRGKVTALLGENGAGKSTLMNILSGVVTPTSGFIELDGGRVAFSSTTEARNRGISIIHQELSLRPTSACVTTSSWAESCAPRPASISPRKRARRSALIADLEEEIDPLTLVEDLRLGQQQIVEIARALSVNSRILIMDEPTSAPERDRSGGSVQSDTGTEQPWRVDCLHLSSPRRGATD